MNMTWLESLIYGLFSGISEFLPVSSSAHQQLLLHLFGIDKRDPVRDFFIHVAMLFAVITSCKSILNTIKRETASKRKVRHTAQQNLRAQHDWRLVQGAILPMLIPMLFLHYILNLDDSLLTTALFLVLNGVLLYLPERLVQGNKDARSMSALDSFLIGCAGALSVFSGLSRIGCTYGTSIARGSAKKHALTLSFLLSIPALACLSIMDLIAVFSVGSARFWESLLTYILSGITAYLGSCISISVMRFLTARPSNGGFAYYCWGVSLFSFIIYLSVG